MRCGGNYDDDILQNQHSFGCGLTFKWSRAEVGDDEDELGDGVPFHVVHAWIYCRSCGVNIEGDRFICSSCNIDFCRRCTLNKKELCPHAKYKLSSSVPQDVGTLGPLGPLEPGLGA